MEDLIKKQMCTVKLIMNFVQNFNKTKSEKRDKNYVLARLTLLEKYWETFYDRHDEIIINLGSDEEEKHEYFSKDIYVETECTYVETVAWLKSLLDTFVATEVKQTCDVNGDTHKSVGSTGETKLPRITIPQFNGNYLEWTAFKDMFTTLIANNSSLTDVQRLHYLKANLSGEAELLIRNYTITEANYTSAWNTLVDRYENLHILVQSHIEAIMNAPTIQHETAYDLKRLMNRVTESVQALTNLKRPVSQWDDWLTCIISKKFDQQTRKEWESTLTSSKDLPTFQAIQTFLLARIRVLEAVGTLKNPKYPRSHSIQQVRSNITTTNKQPNKSPNKGCSLCSGNHFLSFCRQFRQLPFGERRDFVKKQQLCVNCLRSNHSYLNCPSIHKCRICDSQHHSMLHSDDNNIQLSNTTTSLTSSITRKTGTREPVILATALVDIFAADGERIRFRALLDQGSQSSFISEFCAQSLNLPRKKVNVSVTGIGCSSAGSARGAVSIRLASTVDPEFTFDCEALILRHLTTPVQATFDGSTTWTHLVNLQLADPYYLSPDGVDVILGADVYGHLLVGDIRKGAFNQPVAQRTHLGWIISGLSSSTIQNSAAITALTIATRGDCDLSAQLKSFWEIEDIAPEKMLTEDEEYCESFYGRTVQRMTDGRYVVRLPIAAQYQGNIQLGNSRHLAIQRLRQIERKFHSEPELQTQYVSFMDQYLELGHMQQISPLEVPQERVNTCYLPHHGILKAGKLRVVFDGSVKTSNGYALNDRLLVGPKLQREICAIIFNWRRHRIVFTTDVEKMFRQVRVNEIDCSLQRIVWRRSPSDDIQDYQLNTVTYGTTSAPYLALKTLQRLAQDEATKFPEASKVLLTDTYVDDILSGANDVDAALTLQQDLIKLLQAGGFNLRKWSSNSPELISHLPPDHRNGDSSLSITKADPIKTLGIYWVPQLDQFRFQVQVKRYHNVQTKRTILSDISKLYDPLGWLGPVLITAKIMIQQLWLLTLDWDDPLPSHVAQKWVLFSAQLKHLEHIQIDRWIGTSTSNMRLELHGFADASLSAYAAVLYIRVVQPDGTVKVNLIASKSKVAPIKTISLPRLELCGAVLLARLIKRFTTESIVFDSIFAWTDSSVVLAWLRSHPSRWKVFIANRVSEIHQTMPPEHWNYVSTKENPADCASRGLFPAELNQHPLWWNGPSFLNQRHFERTHIDISTSSEALREERTSTLTHHAEIKTTWTLLQHFSSLSKLLRITAYIFRFVHNCQSSTNCRRVGYLTVDELHMAKAFWIRQVQAVAFSLEIVQLKANHPVSRRSPLWTLNPFLDNQDILRVGGRLKNSFIDYSAQHPIILPKDSHFSVLIITDAHYSTLHGGPQLTLAFIRRQYWILRSRNLVRKRLRNCIECIRHRPTPATQMMADLPAPRVTPSRPFLHCGIDYAGPIVLKSSRGRGYRSFKGYVAVFVCLSTKAVHLEAVSSMTTDDFLAAFRRFVSRRGICSDVYTDRGTNFIGASREIKALFKEASRTWYSDLGEILATKNITWHFIPPYSPHFGGIWEAAVKSFKFHFRRIVKDRTLTFEEISTLLADIEACLNSRPLSAMSCDAEDFEPLTPGHFLVGDTLKAVPEPNLLEVNPNLLKRWKFLLQMKQHFWRRWSRDYLQTLQQRYKWSTPSRGPQVGELVLVKEERLSPTKWLLARIEATHPGEDGKVRVATIRCRGTIFKRPITKLCLLPLEADSSFLATRQGGRDVNAPTTTAI